MAKPGRGPPSRCAATAAGGWNAAEPRPPTTSAAASMAVELDQPMALSAITATMGPTVRSTRGRQRSASHPKPSCDTEPATWKSIASVPAAASDRPSRGISRGRSGA